MSVTMRQIDELRDYVQLMTDRGEPPASMEDAVLGFREFREVVAGIRQAREDFAAGKCCTLEDLERRLNAKHDLVPRRP